MKITNLKNLLSNFIKDVKAFSFGVAIGRFRKDFPCGKWEKRRVFYENRVYNYLKKRFAPLIVKLAEEHNVSSEKTVDKKIIWVMWWQGVDSMPEVVRICYNRLLKVAQGCEVNLITQDNYAEYVDLPQHILKKLSEKKITLTHFSDIVRVNLLNRYGGAWIDATVYVEYLPEAMFDNKFYTLHAPGLFPEFINRGEWMTFVFAGTEHNILYYILCGLFESYWDNTDVAIDYLFFDYFIRIITDVIPEIYSMVLSVKENREFYNLNVNINNTFDKNYFCELMCISPLQKLTYKKELKKTDDNKALTNYGWISERDKNENLGDYSKSNS